MISQRKPGGQHSLSAGGKAGPGEAAHRGIMREIKAGASSTAHPRPGAGGWGVEYEDDL